MNAAEVHSNATGFFIRLLLALGRVPPFCRGQLRGLMAKTIVKLNGAPIMASFHGATFFVTKDAHTTEHAMLLNQHYNEAEINFLKDGIPVGGVALDLGSNIGLYSLPMAVKAGQNGKVLSLDASAAFTKKLAANAKASGLNNIVQEVIAVGDRYDSVSLMAVEGNPGTATVESGAAGVSVEMQPLLDILARHGISHIDAMKIDIDGSEEIALVPFLRNAEPSLLPKRLVMEHVMLDMETSALAEALRTAGYKIVAKTKSNSLYQRFG